MNAPLKFALLVALSVLLSCEDNSVGKAADPTVTTDKTSYQLHENVIVTVDNITGEELSYYVCSGSRYAPYMIQQLNGLTWEVVYGSLCNGFMSYCCKAIPENELFQDTISLQDFAVGLYRIEYDFQTNEEWKEYYSKIFEIH